jgi:hypothetical protein
LESYQGAFFLTEVADGSRMFIFEDFVARNKSKYNLIAALGIILVMVGLCAFIYNSKFKLKSE